LTSQHSDRHNDTQVVNFDNLDVVVTLNSAFDKTRQHLDPEWHVHERW
jgi:hypothetical protein